MLCCSFRLDEGEQMLVSQIVSIYITFHLVLTVKEPLTTVYLTVMYHLLMKVIIVLKPETLNILKYHHLRQKKKHQILKKKNDNSSTW